MKAQSDIKPEIFTKSRKKLFFNFNIEEVMIENEEESHITFEYDYVEIINKKRSTLIKALMRNSYALEDEIALINNNAEGKTIEYKKYLIFRNNVKMVVNNINLETK